MNTLKTAAVLGVLALLWSGCDSGPAAAPSTAKTDTAVQDLSSGTDSGGSEPSDTASDTPFTQNDLGTIGDDTQSDVAVLDLGGPTTANCDFVSPKPGACGFSCTDNAVCTAGFCIPTRNDRVCTANCQYSSECPEGWTCAQLAGAPDTVYGCLPTSPNLGRPCNADLDCVMMVGQTAVGLTDICIAQGSAGSFCASDCALGQTCGKGFVCKTVKTAAGKDKKACIAETLDGNCTDRFEYELAETTCGVQNDNGTCTGKRHCEKGKLTACSAATPQPETCNGKDDNCNGTIDEPVPGAGCQITVGTWQCPGTPLCVAGKETCVGTPPAPEACNGKDDNCNGKVDEGCDDDQDLYCDAGMAYDPAAKICPKGSGDCDDEDAGRYPAAKETCNGADDNCNGLTDGDDPLLTLNDVQKCEKQQGVCQGSLKPAALCQAGKWLACSGQTYQQWNAAYATSEVCDDKDNDCSGSADEGCNDDQDGFCDAKMATIGFPLSCTKGGGDCQDDDPSVVPGSMELCDDKDQNCNGQTDEGCDDDKDGNCDATMQVVGSPKGCPLGGGDCDDGNAKRYKGAKELCNGLDDDCSGTTDETFATLGDSCKDGAGICLVSGTVVCSADGSKAVCSVGSPAPQNEICDNLDNNCDGQTDEGCDDDQDGYCDTAMATAGKPKVCFLGQGDCDDSNASIHPVNKELCDGVDNDCDGKTDGSDGDLAFDDPQNCEKQVGVCKGAKKAASLCVGGKWLACNGTDYGGWSGSYTAAELCDNADNDCNGQTDEGCDDDDDGYCSKSKTILGFVQTCEKGIGDCNDLNAAVHPFAIEQCDDVDNDCNFKVDEGCDEDADNFCALGKIIPNGFTPKICTAGGNDCNDTVKTINPAAKEICADFVDNNCDGQTDEGCPSSIPGFVGQLGPDFRSEGFLQCAGFYDQLNSDDVPLGWGLDCADKNWSRLRVACGAGKTPGEVRYIDVKKNVFALGLLNNAEYGLISGSNFNLNGDNLIKADSSSPNTSRSWWVSAMGCSEALGNLTVNNPSCGWEASNCFGQNLSGPRYLFVYVAK